MSTSSTTIGLAVAIGDIDVAPAVTADGEPTVAFWAGDGDLPALVPTGMLHQLVLTIAACHAQAVTTASDLRGLGRLA